MYVFSLTSKSHDRSKCSACSNPRRIERENENMAEKGKTQLEFPRIKGDFSRFYYAAEKRVDEGQKVDIVGLYGRVGF